MNTAVEFHDSKVVGIDLVSVSVRVRLSAYVHRSAGVPGQDSGTGWTQTVEIVFADGTVIERPNDLPFALWDGKLSGTTEFDGLVPVPLSVATKVRLDGIAVSGARLIIVGSAAEIAPVGEAIYVEDCP